MAVCLMTELVFFVDRWWQGMCSIATRDFIWLLSPNALRTLCRSQNAGVPWPEKPELQLTPCGHVRWTWHFVLMRVELSIDGISTSYVGGCDWGCSLHLENMNLTETSTTAGCSMAWKTWTQFTCRATNWNTSRSFCLGAVNNLQTGWEHFQKVFFESQKLRNLQSNCSPGGLLSEVSGVSTCRTTVWRICPSSVWAKHVDLICLFLPGIGWLPFLCSWIDQGFWVRTQNQK